MKTNLKMAIIITIVILVPLGSVALLFLWSNKKKEDEKSDDETKSVKSDEKTVNVSNFPLKQGSSGDLVKSLQEKLNVALWKSAPIPPYVPTYGGVVITKLTEDGSFGPRTLAVVKWKFGTEKVTESQFNTL
ncbi:MAG: hypothetical protein PHI42_06200 [Paludibacteraceae bacterium]|nr:hypothetical protein [Paludibacteraceae bacterium]